MSAARWSPGLRRSICSSRASNGAWAFWPPSASPRYATWLPGLSRARHCRAGVRSRDSDGHHCLVAVAPHAAALAYIGGSLGTLVGADLLNLDKVQGLGAPVASIGGAGTFDGIFVTGILAVLIASLSRRSDRPGPHPAATTRAAPTKADIRQPLALTRQRRRACPATPPEQGASARSQVWADALAAHGRGARQVPRQNARRVRLQTEPYGDVRRLQGWPRNEPGRGWFHGTLGSHQAAGFGLSRIHRPALPAGAPLYAWARTCLHASFENCRKSAAA